MLGESFNLRPRLSAPRLQLSFAKSEHEVREAQRLRFRVFAEEMGAQLHHSTSRIDKDIFDPYCEHLLVRDSASEEVAGTYRILTPALARRVGGFYAETEFDLIRLAHLYDRTAEVGRACVHPDYRSGMTLRLLWSGLIDYMQQRGYDYVIGCASISMADGGHGAASIYRRLRLEHLSPIEWRVFPRHPLQLEGLDSTRNTPLPTLIKGYMRLGCFICGDPAWDPDFNTADLLVMLPMSLMNKRMLDI